MKNVAQIGAHRKGREVCGFGRTPPAWGGIPFPTHTLKQKDDFH